MKSHRPTQFSCNPFSFTLNHESEMLLVPLAPSTRSQYIYKFWSEWLRIFLTTKILLFFQLTKPYLIKLSFLCWKMVFSCILNSIFISFWSVVAFWSIITLFVVQRIIAKTYFAKIIAHWYTFCGLQKLNTLNLRHF